MKAIQRSHARSGEQFLANNPDLQRIDEDDTAQMLDPSGRAARFFWYSDGQIAVRKPNKAVLMRMLAIAERLNARVIGEDGEVYSRDGAPDKPAQFTILEHW
jgi:hypothetical protein